ncbi:shikimate dehydrogenase [Ruegeria arenilitoris]|uniref:shikimate dehydrogenase n=1 Tax=Ruegeria arenilitoris TaxID=1173585 RepID=UPI00147DB31F|nr:shikimate dehydrogenase [Ruegeria arenilitoris]
MKAALIGQGIAGSMTPEMHEAEGRAQGIDLSYGRIDTAKDPFRGMSVADLLHYSVDLGCVAVNVTHPFKTSVIDHLDELSRTAEELQAVNSVVFCDGRMVGHNTDYIGFHSAFGDFLESSKTETVLMFGAGGAGSAVSLALLDSGARNLEIVDPDFHRAQALVSRLKVLRPYAVLQASPTISLDRVKLVDGVVNATPLGMDKYPGSVIEPSLLRPGAWVADIVYFPLETRLLSSARTTGLKVMNGAGMAVHQAAASFEIFTGRIASISRLQSVFASLRQQRMRDVRGATV